MDMIRFIETINICEDLIVKIQRVIWINIKKIYVFEYKNIMKFIALAMLVMLATSQEYVEFYSAF